MACIIKEKEVASGQSKDKTCQVASLGGTELRGFRSGMRNGVGRGRSVSLALATVL